MKKSFYSKLIIMLFLFSMFSTVAALGGEQPVSFKTQITVGVEGGSFQVGFVNVEFKKDFLKLTEQVTYNADIYAENGQVYVEFLPSTQLFFKQVHLRVDSFQGFVYDRATGQNIFVSVKKKQILAPHFSHYLVEW